jgi:hypothetical protein
MHARRNKVVTSQPNAEGCSVTQPATNAQPVVATASHAHAPLPQGRKQDRKLRTRQLQWGIHRRPTTGASLEQPSSRLPRPVWLARWNTQAARLGTSTTKKHHRPGLEQARPSIRLIPPRPVSPLPPPQPRAPPLVSSFFLSRGVPPPAAIRTEWSREVRGIAIVRSGTSSRIRK